MAVVAFGSVRSCGVTTAVAALASVWPADRRCLVVELDPAGGTLAALFGLRPEPGLVSLATAARRHVDPEVIWSQCQESPAGLAVLAAPASGQQAQRALRMLGGALSQLDQLDADVLADCGRLDGASPALDVFGNAELRVLCTRPQLPDLHTLASWCEAKDEAAAHAGVIAVGSGPYPEAEIADALQVEVLGSLPHDPDAAMSLVEAVSSRAQSRRPLLRHARSLAEVLTRQLSLHGQDASRRKADGNGQAPEPLPVRDQARDGASS